MSTPSLGDLLREAVDRGIVKAECERQEKLEKERAEREHEDELLRGLFENAKTVFTSAILAGKVNARIQVGKGQNVEVSRLTNSGGTSLDRPSHPFFKYWKEFSEWADENGLVAQWTYEHDGMGLIDWRSLSVVAKPK